MMKAKIKAVFDFVGEVILIYTILFMIYIALSFLNQIPFVTVPLLIVSFVIEIASVIKKKKESD